jgi:2,6-dihydroxypseudooxynicotine hydrolase
MLVVHGAQDRIFGRVHADRLGAQAPGAELLVFDDGNHGVANRAFQARSASADWLALRL